MGQGVIDALRTVLDTHSPSVVTDGIGQNIGEGLKDGIETSSGTVITAAETLGEELITSLTDSAVEAVEGFDSEYRALEERAREALEGVQNQVDAFASTLPEEMRSIGSQMIAGMADGLYSESGYLYAAMSSIVSEAIEEARRAADTHSPSKKTEKIFEDVGEGMVVGIENKRERVGEATQGVVDEALSIDTSGMIEAAKLLSSKTPDLSEMLEKGAINSGSSGEASISVTVNMDNAVIREAADVDALSQKIAKDVAFAIRQKGKL